MTATAWRSARATGLPIVLCALVLFATGLAVPREAKAIGIAGVPYPSFVMRQECVRTGLTLSPICTSAGYLHGRTAILDTVPVRCVGVGSAGGCHFDQFLLLLQSKPVHARARKCRFSLRIYDDRQLPRRVAGRWHATHQLHREPPDPRSGNWHPVNHHRQRHRQHRGHLLTCDTSLQRWTVLCDGFYTQFQSRRLQHRIFHGPAPGCRLLRNVVQLHDGRRNRYVRFAKLHAELPGGADRRTGRNWSPGPRRIGRRSRPPTLGFLARYDAVELNPATATVSAFTGGGGTACSLLVVHSSLMPADPC
jgi:hypothetical protein